MSLKGPIYCPGVKKRRQTSYLECQGDCPLRLLHTQVWLGVLASYQGGCLGQHGTTILAAQEQDLERGMRLEACRAKLLTLFFSTSDIFF